jgi:hypothetical protein
LTVEAARRTGTFRLAAFFGVAFLEVAFREAAFLAAPFRAAAVRAAGFFAFFAPALGAARFFAAFFDAPVLAPRLAAIRPGRFFVAAFLLVLALFAAFFATVLRPAIFRFAIASSPEVWPWHANAREPDSDVDDPRRTRRP